MKYYRDFIDEEELKKEIYLEQVDVFVYSVGTKKKKINDLTGTSVTKIMDDKVILKLNHLLASDEILAFPPLNLFEEHVEKSCLNILTTRSSSV